MWHRKLFITIMSCLFSCVHSSSSAQTLIEKNNQPKFGIKISCQTCGNMMPFMTPLGSHNTFGSGYPIGVFWQPLKNNSNIADLEVGLFFCSKDVEGNRESIDPDAKMPPCTFKSWNSIPFNVKSIFVPIILKYHPGIKKRFSLNCGLLVSFLVSANAEDPLGELGENRADYHFLKDGSRDPYYLENVDPAYKTHIPHRLVC